MPTFLALITASIGAIAVANNLPRFIPMPVRLLTGFFIWVIIFHYLKKLLKDLRP